MLPYHLLSNAAKNTNTNSNSNSNAKTTACSKQAQLNLQAKTYRARERSIITLINHTYYALPLFFLDTPRNKLPHLNPCSPPTHSPTHHIHIHHAIASLHTNTRTRSPFSPTHKNRLYSRVGKSQSPSAC